jgi:hypothetical protein
MGIAQRASVAALKFGVVLALTKNHWRECIFPTISMYSIPTTQPTVDLSSYVEQRGIIVLVQWFGTTVAVEAVVCFQFHGVDLGC